MLPERIALEERAKRAATEARAAMVAQLKAWCGQLTRARKEANRALDDVRNQAW